MYLNIELENKRFKNHIAKYKDYGNIKIIDFKNPKDSTYRIRFLFEEDFFRLHISGDLGELIAVNFKNMCFDKFEDFLKDIDYFKTKIVCCNRPLYFYNKEKAKNDLEEYFEDFYWDEIKDEKIEELVDELDEEKGWSETAYNILYSFDYELAGELEEIGKEESGIIELYMLAYNLAIKQLKENKTAAEQEE